MLGADDGADAAAAAPVGDDLEPDGVHEPDEVVADLVGEGLVEDAALAEGLEVELEALELDADATVARRAGLEAEGDGAEVGVAGLRAQGGELLGDVLDDERGVGGGGEGVEEGGVGHGGSYGWPSGRG